MEDLKSVAEISKIVTVYIHPSPDLKKMQPIRKFLVKLADLITYFVVGLVAVLFILFSSLFAVFQLSSPHGNGYLGFVIVAGFYLLIGLIMILFPKD